MSPHYAARVPEPSCLSLPENQFYGYVCVSTWNCCIIPLSQHGCYIRKHFILT